MVEKNPQILFDCRPAKGKLSSNQSNAGIADSRLSVSMAGQHIVDSDANSADLLAILINNNVVHAEAVRAGLNLRDTCHEDALPGGNHQEERQAVLGGTLA